MRWLVGVMTALLLATMAATTVGEALDDGGPRAAAPSATTAAPSTPATSAPPRPEPTASTGPATTGTGPTTATSTTATTPGLTPAEVAAHASSDSCWLIVSGRVYDVTTYLRSHPGGSRTITPWCGRESTEAFATEDGEGEHSDKAYALLEDYFIGALAG
jgi:hypothetical protein